MSNYTKATNFAAKDSLASGNPAKIVKGTEIDAEFSAIETAISTKADSSTVTSGLALKADLASPALTGTPTAPTAAATTDNTQVATTAFVWDCRQLAPAFSAYAAANQSVTSGVVTKVTLGTERFDTAACFASSRFTPNVAGYYQINGVVRSYATNAQVHYASIYKNGSEYTRGDQKIKPASSDFQQCLVADVVYLDGVTDYVELYGFVDGTSPRFDFNAVSATSSFSGSLVRPA